MAPKKPKKIKVQELKGIKLYNFLVRRLGEENKKLPNTQQVGAAKRRSIVSKEIYPKFKGKAFTLRDINSELKRVVKVLPPKEICNPLYLSEAYLAFVEYYEIDNHIRTVLPDCIDVKVNAGQYGKTKIFNTMNYSYYDSGVRKIIENIREGMAQNESGMAYFSGVVKLKRGKKNNGIPENYYVEYVLYVNDEAVGDDSSVDFDLPVKEQKKVDDINTFLASKFKELQKEKRKRKRIAKKKEPKKPTELKKEVSSKVSEAIKSLNALKNLGVLSKADFDRQKKKLLALKNKK